MRNMDTAPTNGTNSNWMRNVIRRKKIKKSKNWKREQHTYACFNRCKGSFWKHEDVDEYCNKWKHLSGLRLLKSLKGGLIDKRNKLALAHAHMHTGTPALPSKTVGPGSLEKIQERFVLKHGRGEMKHSYLLHLKKVTHKTEHLTMEPCSSVLKEN